MPSLFEQSTLISKMYAGSRAYGTALPTSDVDFRGIFVAPRRCIHTPFFTIKEQSVEQDEDTKFYELCQFMTLYTNCNPNIIELLWTDDADIVHKTPAFDMLQSVRQDLLSSKAAFTTSGYALAQLKRIKGHNKWISNPQPEQPPVQIDYVTLLHSFTEEKKFKIDLRDYRDNYRLVPYSNNVYGVYKAEGYQTFSDDMTLNTVFNNDFKHYEPTWLSSKFPKFFMERRIKPDYIVKFNIEVYKEDLVRWNQYWDWKKNRNKSRSELEEKYGFDTKHAMHLVRLLRMGVEILTEGVVHVKRDDAQELLSIRNGSWSYEELIEYAERTDKYIRDELYHKTKLPKRPNLDLASDTIMKVQDLVWSQQ